MRGFCGESPTSSSTGCLTGAGEALGLLSLGGGGGDLAFRTLPSCLPAGRELDGSVRRDSVGLGTQTSESAGEDERLPLSARRSSRRARSRAARSARSELRRSAGSDPDPSVRYSLYGGGRVRSEFPISGPFALS